MRHLGPLRFPCRESKTAYNSGWAELFIQINIQSPLKVHIHTQISHKKKKKDKTDKTMGSLDLGWQEMATHASGPPQ